MENISALQNSYNNQLTPDVQNKTNNQENFTALDREKLKQDSIEIANKTKENANDNIIFRVLRNIGVKDPKKTLKSLGMSILTIIGVMFVCNKITTPAAKLGNYIDDILTGDNILGRCRNGLVGLFKSAGTAIKDMRKPKFVENVQEALKSPLTPKWNLLRGFENGAKGLFSNTIVETITTGFDKNKDSVLETLTKVLGGDSEKAKKLLTELPEVMISDKMGDFLSKNKLSNEILQKIQEKGVFDSDTEKLVEALKNAFSGKASGKELRNLAKNLEFSEEAIKKLSEKNILAEDTDKLIEFLRGTTAQIAGCKTAADNFNKVKFADKVLEEIAQANGCIKDGIIDRTKLSDTLIDFSNGKFGDGLKYIKMDEGGPFSSWWPANLANSIYKAITKKDSAILQGNLGDSMIKYGAVRGKLAQTMPAKFVQIVPPLVGDQITNFVNDKSGFGVLLCANLIGNYNKLQDTPKEKRVTTAANDVASGSISWLIGMPITYGTIYSLASLSKVQGKDIPSRLIRGIGKIFAFGHDCYGKKGVATAFGNGIENLIKNFKNKNILTAILSIPPQKIASSAKTFDHLGGLKGIAGGLGRFGLALLVISPFVSRKIDALCAKILGKPYDPAEAEKAKQLEEAKNQPVPGLNITQGELLEKMQNNPEVMQKIQNDPELLAKVQNDPKALLDLLEGKENTQESSKNVFNGQTLSPATKNILNNRNQTASAPQASPSAQAYTTPSNSTNKFLSYTETNKIGKKSKDQSDTSSNTNSGQIDHLTYIPSSKGMVKTDSTLSQEQLNEYNAQMERAEKLLKQAEKYI